ncbi:heavy-metal-associated domain-containing protein [Microbacterium algeriense]|uniref:Heavy-metal-associated domain-containing protein n=2 Tax=Microbacterium algeriense TaxID=2615184 RepID=A0ABQ6V594_9MICO|nr:heavy metal-associated domain-containing protein [Microbacterium algeriense]KAB1864336.1 heavy-metal-associated domain-containing protein [Microbacterium algeriense]
MRTSEYQVTGMSCGHCEVAIRGEVGQVPGVDSIEVSARTGRLVVTSAGPIDDDAILAAVDEAGYQATRSR